MGNRIGIFPQWRCKNSVVVSEFANDEIIFLHQEIQINIWVNRTRVISRKSLVILHHLILIILQNENCSFSLKNSPQRSNQEYFRARKWKVVISLVIHCNHNHINYDIYVLLWFPFIFYFHDLFQLTLKWRRCWPVCEVSRCESYGNRSCDW